MVHQHRFWIGSAVERIALVQWKTGDARKPTALLLHGTSFCADVWDEIACDLATHYVVYALDRRGHGESHKPAAECYHFEDYARDLCRVIDALDLRDVYGIGHSAGATDLLLAAKLLPDRFSRLFVMEPTIMDPRARADGGLSDKAAAYVQGTLRRQPEFDSATIAFNRYRAAPAFAVWSEGALWAYVRHGFETLPDGRVRLSCRPEIEAAMLRPIFAAMEQVYAGDERGNPFASLTDIDCPVRVATAENSWAIYKEMAARAVALIPAASQWMFDGVGHCVAQEAPELLLQALAAFDAESA